MKAIRLVQNAQEEVKNIRLLAELDLSEVVFGEGDSWREVLEEEVQRAIRFQTRFTRGEDRYEIHVDWVDRIEVVRLRDAFSWVFTPEEFEEGDEDILDPLREHLERFTGLEALSEMGTLDETLAAALLQHRARNALDKLGVALGTQLSLAL